MLMLFSVCLLKYSTHFAEHRSPFCVAVLIDANGVQYVHENTLRILGPVHTGADPFGSGPKLERIGLACTRDLLYPIQFGSAIRTSLGQIE